MGSKCRLIKSPPSGGNQTEDKIMKYSLSYMDIKRKDQKKATRREDVIGLVGGLLMLAIYAIASNMAYNDCLQYGIC